MIELIDISKKYGETPAVRSVSLEVETGKITVLIGPSGSGKSTLLRTIIGLIKPDRGGVKIDGETLNQENIIRLRQMMGYVIQEGGLFPHLSCFENVTLMAGYLGWEKKIIDGRFLDLCKLTNFPVDALDRYPLQISGGQRQRVGLMRALMLDPDILLLDEPLGALDPLIRADLQNDLKNIFSSLNKTVVMVTHDIGEAAFFGDKIVLLKNGHIVQEGTIQSLINQPSSPFVTNFINVQRNHLDTLEGIKN